MGQTSSSKINNPPRGMQKTATEYDKLIMEIMVEITDCEGYRCKQTELLKGKKVLVNNNIKKLVEHISKRYLDKILVREGRYWKLNNDGVALYQLSAFLSKHQNEKAFQGFVESRFYREFNLDVKIIQYKMMVEKMMRIGNGLRGNLIKEFNKKGV